ncbi:hypothetical protein MKEN_01492600 [Mycena kentingensis (nom. inval.)]|nr:hypothetical protein MKEN_01492600 [Mycena kentingensis (nom. inval.)]
MASPTPGASSDGVKVWTGEEALAAWARQDPSQPTQGKLQNLTAATTQVANAPSNQIWLWPEAAPFGTGTTYWTFGQGFFFCVDFTNRDTFFNDQAQSYFAATDLSCNLYLNAGCSGTAIVDAPRGNFIALTGIFDQAITSLSCEWQP